MSEEIAFLTNIRERGADRMGLLVYADWLEEHDQEPLAEFIRLQCRTQDLFYSTNADGINERIKLQEQERQLISAHEGDVFPENSVAGMWQKKLYDLFGDKVKLATHGWQNEYGYDKAGENVRVPLFYNGLPTVEIKGQIKDGDNKITVPSPHIAAMPFASVMIRPGQTYGSAANSVYPDITKAHIDNRASIVLSVEGNRDFYSERIRTYESLVPRGIQGINLDSASELKILGRRQNIAALSAEILHRRDILKNLQNLELFSTTPPNIQENQNADNIDRILISGIRYSPIRGVKYVKISGMGLPGSILPTLIGADTEDNPDNYGQIFRTVKRLDLSHNELGYQNGLEDLQERDIPFNQGLMRFMGAGIPPLSPNLAALTALDLSNNYVVGQGEMGVAIFTIAGRSAPLQKQLSELSLADNGFENNQVARMKRSPMFKDITCLDFSRDIGCEPHTYSTRLKDIKITGLRGR